MPAKPVRMELQPGEQEKWQRTISAMAAEGRRSDESIRMRASIWFCQSARAATKKSSPGKIRKIELMPMADRPKPHQRYRIEAFSQKRGLYYLWSTRRNSTKRVIPRKGFLKATWNGCMRALGNPGQGETLAGADRLGTAQQGGAGFMRYTDIVNTSAGVYALDRGGRLPPQFIIATALRKTTNRLEHNLLPETRARLHRIWG